MPTATGRTSLSHYILSQPHFPLYILGINNRTYSQDCFHSFNKYPLSINHMPGTVLGARDTVMNMIITSCLVELSLSGCWETHMKKGLLQTSKNYTIMKYCSSSVFPDLVKSIPFQPVSSCKLGNCPQLPLLHHAQSSNPSPSLFWFSFRKAPDMYYFSSSFPCFYTRHFVSTWIIISLVIMIMASIYWLLTIWQALY